MNIKSINLEPVAMPGEGQYNLNNLKEIKVKEPFFDLPPEDINCQHNEPIDNCTTRQYKDSLVRNCGCLPLKMRRSNEVCNCWHYEFYISMQFMPFQEPLCTSQLDFKCVNGITIDKSNCLSPCTGLIATSYYASDLDEDLESLIPEKIVAYRNYTKWTKMPAGLEGFYTMF